MASLPSRLVGMGPCPGTSSGPSTLSWLSSLADIVPSCFLGHFRFLGPFGGGRHRLTLPFSVDLRRGARKHKELLLGALQRIEHHTHRAGNNRRLRRVLSFTLLGKVTWSGRDGCDGVVPRPLLVGWSSQGQRRSLSCTHAGKPTRLAQGAPFRLDQRHVWTAVATAPAVRLGAMVPSPLSSTWKSWFGLSGHRDTGCNPFLMHVSMMHPG